MVTYTISTTVVEMMVSGDSGNDRNAKTFSSRSNLGDIEWIDGCSFVGGLVYKQVGIVVLADGNWDDLH